MKKSITVIFFFNALFFYKSVTGQSCDSAPYRHIYYNKGFNQTQAKKFSFASNNDIFLSGFANQDPKNSNVDAWLMRTTFHGTPLWSKVIGTPADETINSIKTTTKGDYVFAGNTKYNSAYNAAWLAKIDSSGNPLWSLELKSSNGTLYQTEELDNGDLFATGTLYLQFKGDGYGNITSISRSTNLIMRIDNSGKVIWQRSFYHNNKESLRGVQQISDGNLIVTGIVSDSSIIYILKINQYTGDIIWMNRYKELDNYNYTHIKENADGSFVFKTGNQIYYLTADGKFKTGAYEINLTSDNKPINHAQILDVGTAGENEIYYVNVKPNPILFCINNNKTALWARTYNFGPSGELSLGGGRIFRNNIYLPGSYKTGKISDTTSKEQMAYLLKATMQGETFCSDTSNISFKISNIPPAIDTSYSWIDEGSVVPEFIPVYSKNIEPVRLLNCSQQDCCNDIAITKNDKICDNSVYKLPDETIVTKPGFYISRMNTLTGCDSIIYTILSPAKKIDLSLSKDTCFINNAPITYVLPVDSSVQYRWQDGTGSAEYTINFPGKYWVTATSACNVFTDSINVHDNCEPVVFIPSGFTPNNDGLNDVFRVPEINGQHLSNLNIYNRFGQLIFHSNNISDGWDGTISGIPQSAGTYIYLIRYADISGKPHLLKGTISLIR